MAVYFYDEIRGIHCCESRSWWGDQQEWILLESDDMPVVTQFGATWRRGWSEKETRLPITQEKKPDPHGRSK